MRLIFIGLSITSSWGNGHATTYRALLDALGRRGHDVLFLERDMPWYASHRDTLEFPGVRLGLYESLDQLATWRDELHQADVVVIGSFVPDGIAVCESVFETAHGLKLFYDIDTPVTLDRLRTAGCDYLDARHIPEFDAYLTFSGGPGVVELAERWGARQVCPFYCSVDLRAYFPDNQFARWDLGYLGTYSEDRQAGMEERLLIPALEWSAGRFVVAGPRYPADMTWPPNVERIEHLPPAFHRGFYNQQRFTLNLTRAPMIEYGFSPSVRLFEAAACGVPIVSDRWAGLDSFFREREEIFVADTSDEVMTILRQTMVEDSVSVALKARERVAREHSSEVRAWEFEQLVFNLQVAGARLAGGVT